MPKKFLTFQYIRKTKKLLIKVYNKKITIAIYIVKHDIKIPIGLINYNSLFYNKNKIKKIICFVI